MAPKMLQKCIGWASKPIQQPSKSKNGVQSDPKRSKKSTKATPSGAKERPRRPQVTPRAAKIRPFAPQDCRGDLLAWFGSVSAPFCCHFSLVWDQFYLICSWFFKQFLSHFLLQSEKFGWGEGWGVGVGESTLSKCTSIRIKFLQDQIQWLARCGIALQLGYLFFTSLSASPK